MATNQSHPKYNALKGTVAAHLKSAEFKAKHPQVDYVLPEPDPEFAQERNSYRKRDHITTESVTAKEGQIITLHIPDQPRSLIPQDTIIRWRLRVNNIAATTFINGSVQRAIKRVRIFDGHGKMIEEINDYNRIQSTLFDVHTPHHIKYRRFQQEGVYMHELPARVVGPQMIWDNRGGSTFTTIHQGNADKSFFFDQNEDQQGIGAQSGAWAFQRYMFHAKHVNDGSYGTGPRANQTLWHVQNQNNIGATYFGEGGLFGTNPGGAGLNTDQGVDLQDTTIDMELGGDGVPGKNMGFLGQVEYTSWWENVGRYWFNNQYATFQFHLTGCGFFSSTKHVPLWITKGLRIELELEENDRFIQDRLWAQTVPDAANRRNQLQNFNLFPQYEISKCEVVYTAVDLTPAMIAAIDQEHMTKGIHMCFPTYYYDEEKIGAQTGIVKVQIDYRQNFAMLNRIYSYLRVDDTLESGGFKFRWDSFAHWHVKPLRRYWEYNRTFRPFWGFDIDMDSDDHFTEHHKSLQTLNDYASNTVSLSQFKGNPTDEEEVVGVFVDNLETEPAGFLTGTDTNNRVMRYKFEWNTGVDGQNTDIDNRNLLMAVIYNHYKLIVYRAGEPVIVKS